MKNALMKIGKWVLAIVGLAALVLVLSPVIALLLKMVFKFVVKE